MTQKLASIPTNLFIDTPEMQDVSLHQLSSDVDSWPEEITQKLKERVPVAANLNMMIKFMKKDAENGAATGSIVLNSTDKSAVIPVIIKDFMMYPLDVMITEKKILPLTPDYFMSVFSTNQVFDKTEDFPSFGGLARFEDSNLWSAIYPPSMGRYAYASASWPMMDLICESVDATAFKAQLVKDASSAMRFHKHGHAEAIKKIANLQPVNMNEFRRSADALIPRNISMLRFDGPNKYTLLQNADNVFSPALSPMKRQEAVHFLSTVSDHVNDDINEVDRNGEKLLAVPKDDGGIFLAKPDRDVAESCDEFDHYVVKNKNGVAYTGLVIPHVIAFNQKPVDLKIFVCGNMGTIQAEIYGVRVKNHRFAIRGSMPAVGQTGTFVFQPDQTHAIATVPVTIESILQDTDKTVKMKVVDALGASFSVKISPDLELHRIAQVEGGYIIPHKMRWQVLEGFDQVTNSAEDYAVKTAGARLTTTPVTLIPTGFSQYAMRGVNKYAAEAGWDRTCLERYQVKFLLASLGCGTEKIAEVLLHAHRAGSAEIHGLKDVQLKGEKIAAAIPAARLKLASAAALRTDLVKEASYFADSQTVDALLSLNFVNPENVQKFVGKIPLFKSAISHMASCLIASRLGIQEIPEQAATSAMAKLVEVVNGLEKLRATQTMGIN
jgi:hypothetical protein